jgi:arabinogalactan endo-1,4-beta-galactosidase
MLITSLLFTFVTSALASPWSPGGPPSNPWGPPATTFYKGHDLSSLRLFEPGHSAPLNVTFRDAQHGNVSKPADEILAAGGMNTVRLRLWVDPTSGDQWVC